MRERISNILVLSGRIEEELSAFRLESGKSTLSEASKESICENIDKMNTYLNRVRVLSGELIDYSSNQNMNLQYHERKLIVLALKKNYGHRGKSASDLKISGRTILRKIDEHKILISEYMEVKPHKGRGAISVKYRNKYYKMIDYINSHDSFWMKDLMAHMRIKERYSVASHLIDYLRTKELIECFDTDGREMKYRTLRPITDDDLIFVKGNGVKVANVVMEV
jgi:hypothetical protein